MEYGESFAKCGWCGVCAYGNSTTGEYIPCMCRLIGNIWIMLPSFAWRWDTWKGFIILWGIGYRTKKRWLFKKSFWWSLYC